MPLFGGKNTTDATLRVNYRGEKAEKGLNKLSQTIKTVITVAVINKVKNYTIELAKLGAEAETVSKSFESFAKQAGRSQQQAMNELRTATMGMVNDLELQQNAMKALISGVTFDDLIVAMEFVTKFAATTGADASQKMTTVMTGLARQSAVFFDDVGILVTKAADVNAAAIQQMKEKMGDFSISSEDASVKSANFSESIKNLRQNIGRLLVPAFTKLLDIAGKYVDKLVDATELHLELGKTEDVIRNNREQLEVRQKLVSIDKKIKDETAKQVPNQEKLRSLWAERYRFAQKLLKVEKETSDIETGLKAPSKPKRKKKSKEELEKEKQDQLDIDIFFEKMEAKRKEKEARIRAEKLEEEVKVVDEEIALLEEQLAKREEIARQIRVAEVGEFQVGIEERKRAIDIALDEELISLEEAAILRKEIETDVQEHNRSELERTGMTIENQIQRALDLSQSLFNTATTLFTELARVEEKRTLNSIEKQRKAIDNQVKEGSKSRRKAQKEIEELEERAEKIRQKSAQKQKALSLVQSIINTALAVSKANSAAPPPINIPLMIAAAAAGAAQTAIIAATPAFQTGGLIGGTIRNGKTEDNRMIRAGDGEFIVNAQSTAQNIDLLESINNNTANLNNFTATPTNITFVGLSVEQISQALVQVRRRGDPAIIT